MLDTDSLTQNKQFVIDQLQSVNRDGIDNLINYLNKMNFFFYEGFNDEKMHYKGSLCQHSINVFKILSKLNILFNTDIDFDSIKICGLLHDICRCDNRLIAGHSEKSVFILQQFIKLTDEEIMAINCHMGYCDSRNNDYNNFEKAIYEYPLVMLLYFSDMISVSKICLI